MNLMTMGQTALLSKLQKTGSKILKIGTIDLTNLLMLLSFLGADLTC